MAAKTATVLDIQIARGPDDVVGTLDTAHTKLHRVFVTLNHGGQAVDGATDTLDCDIAALLATRLRRSKLASDYTLRHIALEQAAVKMTSAGVQTAITATAAISGTTVQLTLKSATDGTTAATIAAADAMFRPYRVFCVVNEA